MQAWDDLRLNKGRKPHAQPVRGGRSRLRGRYRGAERERSAIALRLFNSPR